MKHLLPHPNLPSKLDCAFLRDAKGLCMFSDIEELWTFYNSLCMLVSLRLLEFRDYPLPYSFLSTMPSKVPDPQWHLINVCGLKCLLVSRLLLVVLKITRNNTLKISLLLLDFFLLSQLRGWVMANLTIFKFQISESGAFM